VALSSPLLSLGADRLEKEAGELVWSCQQKQSSEGIAFRINSAQVQEQQLVVAPSQLLISWVRGWQGQEEGWLWPHWKRVQRELLSMFKFATASPTCNWVCFSWPFSMHLSLPSHCFLVFSEWVPLASFIPSGNWFPYAMIGVLVQFLQVIFLSMWCTGRHMRLSYLSTLIGHQVCSGGSGRILWNVWEILSEYIADLLESKQHLAYLMIQITFFKTMVETLDFGDT
jgi:hypothetical protein